MTKSGVRYWSGGEINLKAMNEMMRAQKLVGVLKDDPDWSKIIDEQLPARRSQAENAVTVAASPRRAARRHARLSGDRGAGARSRRSGRSTST